MKKRLPVLAVLLLLAALAAWRLWPLSLNDALGTTGEVRVTRCWVTCAGVTEEAEPYIDMYELDEEDLPQVQRRLADMSYRRDWRMLLPWTVDSVGGSGLGISAMVFLDAGGTDVILHLLSDDIMHHSMRDIYHFSDDDLLPALKAWALEFGVKQ